VCWVREGDRVRAGQRLGMIKLGSQVVLRLPPGAQVLVGERQPVRAGETVLALLPREGTEGRRVTNG
jgi:phosphatidylserine decarboxylase